MTLPATARRLLLAASLAAGGLTLSGCTVLAVAGAAAGVAVTGAGLAVDAAVGAVKLTGKAVGVAADVVLPDADE